MLNKDLHKMNFIMSMLYFTACVLSIFTGIVTDVFVFVLLGCCFAITGTAYLYIYGLERLELQKNKKVKCNLDATQVFKKVE